MAETTFHDEPERARAIKARFVRLESHHAVIELFDQQILLVAQEHVPPETQPGDDVWVTIDNALSREAKHRETAKALLNEILNPDGVSTA